MRKCNFCQSDSNGSKLILKLKPCMLKLLGVRTGLEYYACEDHFDSEATSGGKRRRWAENAKLNVGISDVLVDEDIVKNVNNDHLYAKDGKRDDKDSTYPEALDLKMGEDYFIDSQSLSCKKEIIEDECMIDGSQKSESQVCSLWLSFSSSKKIYFLFIPYNTKIK